MDKHHQPIRADPDRRRANAFDYGSGFVNPSRVLDPGLVYDSHPEDFVAFLCSLGYDERSLHLVTGDNSTCDRAFKTPLICHQTTIKSTSSPLPKHHSPSTPLPHHNQTPQPIPINLALPHIFKNSIWSFITSLKSYPSKTSHCQHIK